MWLSYLISSGLRDFGTSGFRDLVREFGISGFRDLVRDYGSSGFREYGTYLRTWDFGI